MATTRSDVRFDNLHTQAATFEADTTLTYSATAPYGTEHVGKAVTLSEPATVKLADTGDTILGRLDRIESDGKAVVSYHGVVAFTVSDTAPFATATGVIAGASGEITADTAGTSTLKVWDIQAGRVYVYLP